ncbi:MAG: DNA repair protein RadC [Saprospiraceae bacterium]
MRSRPKTDSTNSIKHWATDDRPREKLLEKGKLALSHSELLAILIGSGSGGENALDLARNIMDSCKQDLTELSKLGVDRLCKYKGIGKVKALVIEAALELGRRRQESLFQDKQVIVASRQAYDVIRLKMQDLGHEEFWILYLNRANKIMSVENISKGGITGTVADPRLIFSRALDIKACGVILVHNHPSGSTRPSNQDLELTKKLKSAGQLLDIQVMDHLIVTEDTYYSFADEGML